MASANTSEVFNCSVEQFMKIVTDYEKYPDFLSEVKGCKVLKAEGNRKLVEYKINIIKNFSYSLWMTESTDSVVWEFGGGDLFKKNMGSWKLTDEAGKCRATYSLDVEFGMFVPGPIAKTLVSVNLPNMMSAYTKRVSALYGK